MEDGERDGTQDWLLPEAVRPPLIGELERRVEEALVTARASEAAIMTVGASALDAAEQARRAARLAERASVSAWNAQKRVEAVAAARLGSGEAVATQRAKTESSDDRLNDFSARADRLVARLRQLQRVPLPAPASGPAGRPQSAH